MDIELLKKDLATLLQKDLENRNSISELRRSVFLQSSSSKEKETIISVKEKAIHELTGEIDYLKNQIVFREKNQEEIQQSFHSERNSLLELINEKETLISNQLEEITELQHKCSQLVTLESELDKYKSQNSELTAKVRELMEHISAMQSSHQNYERENTTLKLQLDKLQSEFSEYKQHSLLEISEKEEASALLLELSNQKVKELQAKLDEEILENMLLQDQSDELRKINEQLQSSSFETVNELSHVKNKSEESIAVLRDEITSLEQVAVSLRQERDRLNEQYISLMNSSEESMSVLRDELAGLEQTSMSILELNNQLKSELDLIHKGENETIEVLKNEVADLELLSAESIEALRNEIQAERSSSRLLTSQMEELKFKLSDFESRHQLLLKAKADLEAKIILNETTISALQKEGQEFQQMLSLQKGSLEELSALKESLTHSQNEILVLNKHFSEASEKLLSTESELTRLLEVERTYLQLVHDYENAIRLNEKLKFDLSEHELMISEFMSQIEDLKNESREQEELRQFADELNTEKIKLEETISDLKRELFTAEEELSKLSDFSNGEKVELAQKIENFKNETISLKIQKEELEIEVAILLKKLSEYGKAVENQSAENINLESEQNTVTLAKALAGSLGDKKSVKLKINELLREIDKCIAALNAQS